MKIALLAGTQSGCGKTTIMLALLQYLKNKNKKIISFKAGPDFLDPMWHQLITEQVSYNLDTRMVGIETSKSLISQQQKQADFALIEGVMGMFDGRAGVGETGSSADLAKQLECSVILVINAKGISGSIVPLVSGFKDYAKAMNVCISGVIANHVGSAHHAELLSQFLQEYNLPPLLAWMEKGVKRLPERHLGLEMPENNQMPDFQPFFHVDELAFSVAFDEWKFKGDIAVKQQRLLIDKTIAIAKDQASCFIYQANIDWLIEQGAQLQYFSLMKGDSVPKGADAVWLPGGYPELYAQQLSDSGSWLSLQQFILAGKPVLAECGGAMVLGEQLTQQDGTAWPMSGILPYHSKMQKKLASLGYREDVSGVRGHEFHYSVREGAEGLSSCFDCSRGDKGIRFKNLRLSYIHWYFSSAPDIVSTWFGGK